MCTAEEKGRSSTSMLPRRQSTKERGPDETVAGNCFCQSPRVFVLLGPDSYCRRPPPRARESARLPSAPAYTTSRRAGTTLNAESVSMGPPGPAWVRWTPPSYLSGTRVGEASHPGPPTGESPRWHQVRSQNRQCVTCLEDIHPPKLFDSLICPHHRHR